MVKSFLISFLCWHFLLQPAFCQNDYFYPDELIVTATTLNLRESPSIGSAKMAGLKKGEFLQFIESVNDNEYVEVDSTWGVWLKVRAQGKTGYVFSPYVSGSYILQYEGQFTDDLPAVNWYGVYKRDSFTDEIRPIRVRLVEEMNEYFGEKIKVLKTNQREVSKFIIGSVAPLKIGYAGPLGVFSVHDFFMSSDLAPGSVINIQPGNEKNDTTFKDSYTLVSTGCAQMDANMVVSVNDYRLTLVDYSSGTPPHTQDLTPWVKSMIPGMSPTVQLIWYGDIDGDNKPDAIINDFPNEVGGRSSLFLSSKRRKGEYLRKVCETYFGGD